MYHRYKTNPALAAREIQGMVVSDYQPCFQKSEVEAMFAAPHVPCRSAPRYIYTSADPNGGGPSHMALCSGYYDADLFVVSHGLFGAPNGPITYCIMDSSTNWSICATTVYLLVGCIMCASSAGRK